MATPRNNSLVYFDFDALPIGFDSSLYPFKRNHAYVFLGEIPNISENCTVIDATTGEIHTRYYTVYFKEYTKGEI